MIHLNPIPLYQEDPAFYSFEDAVCIAADLATGEEDGWTYSVVRWDAPDAPAEYVVEVRDETGHLAGFWKDPEK